jgi:periplasmic protein TonB
MIAPGADARADLVRWLACGAIVVLAHVGAAAALLQWSDPIETSEPPAAIVVMLAPLPVAPVQPLEEIAPGPDQVQAEAAPEKPVEVTKEDRPVEDITPEPIAEIQAEVTPARDPEIAVAAVPPEAKPEPPKPADSNPPAPVTSAPQVLRLAVSDVAAAPVQGTPNLSNATTIPKWQSQVAATLERNKRYPPDARAKRHEGVIQVAFSVDRKGHLVASRIVRGSGHSSLDQETLHLLRRAQPFPPPPEELAGDRVDLIVPIRFDLR